MTKYKPVSIQKNAFAFCRYGVAVLVWVSLVLHSKWLLAIVFLIMALSYLLKVERAPFIVLYKYTIGKIINSKEEILNEHAMRFAHLMGSILSFVCLIFVYFISAPIGWVLVSCLAVLKTISAFGLCPASKLYECMGNKTCCAFIKPK